MIWPGQASEHDANHGEAYKGGDGLRGALEVMREAAVVADPRQSSLDDPALGRDDEAMEFVSLDDLQFSSAGLGGGVRRLRPLVAAIGEDAFGGREKAVRAWVEDELHTVAILRVGWMDNDVQQQEAERVNKDMPLPVRDLLARIEAQRIERGASF